MAFPPFISGSLGLWGRVTDSPQVSDVISTHRSVNEDGTSRLSTSHTGWTIVPSCNVHSSQAAARQKLATVDMIAYLTTAVMNLCSLTRYAAVRCDP